MGLVLPQSLVLTAVGLAQSPVWLMAGLAIGGLGNAVAIDVNWRLSAPEVAYIIGDAQAKVVVVGLGSNVLAADEGVDALVLRLEGDLASVGDEHGLEHVGLPPGLDVVGRRD